jgi:hypothetical protein
MVKPILVDISQRMLVGAEADYPWILFHDHLCNPADIDILYLDEMKNDLSHGPILRVRPFPELVLWKPIDEALQLVQMVVKAGDNDVPQI